MNDSHYDRDELRQFLNKRQYLFLQYIKDCIVEDSYCYLFMGMIKNSKQLPLT
jgi:hypothetical protein